MFFLIKISEIYQLGQTVFLIFMLHQNNRRYIYVSMETIKNAYYCKFPISESFQIVVPYCDQKIFKVNFFLLRRQQSTDTRIN